MQAITLNLFGGFDVTYNGTPLSHFRGDKVRGLLAYLAVEADRPHARPVLAALFWPDQPERQALGNLSQALARLRSVLGPDSDALLHATRNSVMWRSGSTVDVTTFLRLAASSDPADLEAAAAIYHGELLAGFGLEDCQAFEEWLLLTRERLLQQALRVLERLADLSLAGGHPGRATDAARRQIALDPWRETAYRQLMRALMVTGDRAGALAAFERCCQKLLDDLGVAPDDATTALATQIRSEQPAVSATPRPSPRASLPAQLTPLIGRDAELALLEQLLRGEARLVTLLGPGGVGKTRLALAAATLLREAFPAGVYWIPLAGIGETIDAGASADSIAGAILDALKMKAGAQRSPADELCEVLRERALLLVLDNCEHLPAVGPLIADLLTAAAGLRVLATSRERLGVYGEELLILGGLPMPDEHASDLTHAAALQLFVARAQRQVRSFGDDETTLREVARLCRVLEGMPLGIELAAHWVGDYRPEEIAAAIRSDLAFLETRDRQIPDRHRSLQAVFDYSWRMLSEVEQHILARLSIFAGGFDRAAALAVAEARPAILAALVDKSLLQRGSAGHYSMHELLRQFAAAQLNTTDTERAAVEARHSTYYLGFVAERGRQLGCDQPREAAAEIQAEIDNVRQAWQSAVAAAHTTELARAAYGWWQFCLLTGRDPESRHTFGMAVARLRTMLDSGGIDAAARQQHERGLSILLAIHTNHLFSHAPYEEMAAEAREAIRLGAANQGWEGEALGYYVLARALQELGQQREARVMCERTIELARAYQQRDPSSELLRETEWLGYIWLFGLMLFVEDYAGGRACVVESLRISQSLHKRRAELFSLASLAMINFYMGDDQSARSGYEQVILLARGLDDRWAEMRVQRELSEVLWVQSEYTQAERMLNTVVTTAREIGVVYEEILALATLVQLHCQIGDMDAATSWRTALVQLLGKPGVTLDCQAAGLRACAVYALYLGDDQQALADAKRAWAISELVDYPNFRADSAVILGHTRVRVGQFDLAAAAYQQAIGWYTTIGNLALVSEPQAGLAQLALAAGDRAQAQTLVETILPMLAERPRARVFTPSYAYLIYLHVLEASGDPRAAAVLHSAYVELMRRAATIASPTGRLRFLERVFTHREIRMRGAHLAPVIPATAEG